MNRAQAIKEMGKEAVEAVERSAVVFSDRVTDGTPDFGFTEFVAQAGNLKMYCFVDSDDLKGVDELDQINWDTVIAETATYEIT